ncbi:hexosyltransferase [Haloarcula hispanica N601]|uniref:Hexosyltransferase n=2 Tax=Haloarcula hispanica TaxID=51589 RepID=V5TNC2_HALHI|nr:glycosyltransferase [Haloarcula hispanica]AEM57715.1 hexosyltransferase / glycosyltransferase [Haloarcula hispanica ATCC 33960]AHB66467.1 hexosyltransferase [Haloarcula hispanica N601]
MNILYYLGSFPKLSESFVLNEIYELENRGHNVVVFALNNPDEDIEHEEYEELDVPVRYADAPSYIDVIDLVSSKVIHPRVLQNAVFKASPKRHAVAFHRSKQCIEFVGEQNLDIDLVHGHSASLERFPGRYVASYYDVPFTVTAHAADLYDNPNRKQLEHIISKVDHVVTISEYNKNYIESEITDISPINVVHAGIRPKKFEPSSLIADMRILTVSRFVEKKGLPYAIEAVSKVIDQFPDLEYHIVGSGEMEDELSMQINNHNLNDTVKLLGNVSDERLVTEFDKASCFLLPCIVAESGDRDGIPVALMESMAMQTPPISTNVSGIPELIDHQQNGLVVEPKNTDGLAEAISSILSDSEKQHRFGEAGREKVAQKFNVEHEADKLKSVFKKAINHY